MNTTIDILRKLEQNYIHADHVSNNQRLLNSDSYYWQNTILKTHDSWSLETATTRNKDNIDRTIGMIRQLISNNQLSEDFTVMEIFCGDGSILYSLKQEFPNFTCIGLDLLYHNLWDRIRSLQSGHNFVQIDFYDLLKNEINLNLDLMITYNTFRGWDNPVGPNNNFNKITIDEFKKWSHLNFKYSIAEGRQFI